MKTMSIKLRMTLWFTVLMLLLSASVYIFMLSISDRVVESDTVSALTKAVENSLDPMQMGRGKFEGRGDFKSYRDGVYLSVYSDDGELLSGMVPGDFDTGLAFEDGQTQRVSSDDTDYYVYDRQVQQQGKDKDQEWTVWVRGVVPVGASAGAIGSIIKIMLFALPLLVLFAALGGYLIAKRAFRPVEQIIRSAGKISGGSDLSVRLKISGAREIRQLSDTFDSMFDRLEKAFKAEKQFTSDASHELRTPTTVILAECDYALESARNEKEYRESLEVIARQAAKMSGLINRMLTFTRLEQGTERISRDYSDLSELTNVVCEEHAETSGGIEIRSDIQSHINAYIDVMLMTRLIDNLIENAVKYGREGGWVKVFLKREAGEIVLTVSDNGIGIAPEDLPHIWNRFYQSDKSAEKREGVGLGLAMVKQIAELHGGTVSAESTLGEGSAFTFRMPG